jgi:hypothetical protein
MEVRFTKRSDREHQVSVRRDDGSTDEVVLDSREFLRHDLAHWAVESVLGLRGGVWGSVAAGGSLEGDALDGEDMPTAESLAGPVQTLMRTEAGVGAYEALLHHHPDLLLSPDAAADLHEEVRRLRGHWRATPYGADMVLRWPPAPPS